MVLSKLLCNSLRALSNTFCLNLVEDLRGASRLPMASPETSTPESSQMPRGEDSTASPPVSEELAKNLSTKFPSLLPGYSPKQQDTEKNLQGLRLGLGQGILYGKKHGLRALAPIGKKGCKGCFGHSIAHPVPALKRPQERSIGIESRLRRFRCNGHYCLHHGEPSDNVHMENNWDMESS